MTSWYKDVKPRQLNRRLQERRKSSRQVLLLLNTCKVPSRCITKIRGITATLAMVEPGSTAMYTWIHAGQVHMGSATGFVWLAIYWYRWGCGVFTARLMTLNTKAWLAINRLIEDWKGALEVIRPNPLLKADSTVNLDQLQGCFGSGLWPNGELWWITAERIHQHWQISRKRNWEQRSGVQIWADSCHITRKDCICCRESQHASM